MTSVYKPRGGGSDVLFFSGFAGLMGNPRSWVARYERQQPGSVPAIYSSSTKGSLPDEVREMLEDRGYPGSIPE